jgi:acetaldehyde dehydrogenase
MSQVAAPVKVAILGSGNIGTDLMVKVMRRSKILEVALLAGIDAASDGLRFAARAGIPVTAGGIEAMMGMPDFSDVRVVFDATSAGAHRRHDAILRKSAKRIIDLTPAAVGPLVIPAVNLEAHLAAPNLNMVTCGGQATVPIVAAVSRVTRVHYAEIVASIASRSAGPGTRANIDEFTETTARAIESVGLAEHGKAIIVLNPAEPPLIMRDTVYCLCEETDTGAITASIEHTVTEVQRYVPGYRLKQDVQFERIARNGTALLRKFARIGAALKVSVFLEVEGAGHYLPAYAGNLDIMTSAALRTAERLIFAEREVSAA